MRWVKRPAGRKCFTLVNTLGLLIAVRVVAAGMSIISDYLHQKKPLST
jgi:hypothetical protein